MHACGGARNRRQEGDVLIVSVLVAIGVNLALRSNAQGRIKVPGPLTFPGVRQLRESLDFTVS